MGALSKGALAGELAEACEMKKSEVSKVLDSLASIATSEVKKAGKVTIPGLCMIIKGEAGNQGGQEGGLWEGDDGEGQACQDHREGLLRGRAEEASLSAGGTMYTCAGVCMCTCMCVPCPSAGCARRSLSQPAVRGRPTPLGTLMQGNSA